MEQLIYLIDSYKKDLDTTVESVVERKGKMYLTLSQTIFYPQGGGQPSDTGTIKGKHGEANVISVRMDQGKVLHEVTIQGTIGQNEKVHSVIDWNNRYTNMRRHSAGHVIHDAIISIFPSLIPIKGDHGNKASIMYKGSIPIGEKSHIEEIANAIIQKNVTITSEFITLDELKLRIPFVPLSLPTGKPLRIVTIGNGLPVPDGGTQVQKTGEIGIVNITDIENSEDCVIVSYSILEEQKLPHTEEYNVLPKDSKQNEELSISEFTGQLLDCEQDILSFLGTDPLHDPYPVMKEKLTGKESTFGTIAKKITSIAPQNRGQAGIVLNETKTHILKALDKHYATPSQSSSEASWFDPTIPGIRPPVGHLHVVTMAIDEITRIFNKIGFTRVRHPEVDWDWYPFEALNMPPNHPARDEWETYFIQYPGRPGTNARKQKIVLTPHTSNGQVREMEKGILPIRMINIAKCYRRQIDVSHTPMFHQFEGLYVDHHVSIAHLKGVLEYFVKNFFGENRTSRIRPFHFQFTEPSFEIDISCGVCNGTGILANTQPCKLCKSGWLELGGAGMVHPVVLRNGGIDPETYSGFAFGWGIERTYMMKSGTHLDDIRLLYSNDVRFLEQF